MIMKKVCALHIILLFLELIARIHDMQVFGLRMLTYYTIDSNILQMLVSAATVYLIMTKKDQMGPAGLAVLHLICAVSLTITFLIALFVLAPQEGFAYYFLWNVAPINHLIGPLISIITFLFMEKSPTLPKAAVFAPMGATILYGIIALILNGVRLLDGPYFFLRVYDTSPGTIILWFCIIAILCMALSALYLGIRKRCSKA